MSCEESASNGTAGCGALVAQEDDLRERERIGMCDRELRRSSADFLETPCGASVQPQLRRPARLPDHFDVTPQHALRVSRPQRFHRRFFRREAPCEMNRRITAPHAIRNFAFGEDSMSESLSVTIDGRRDSGDVRGVEA